LVYCFSLFLIKLYYTFFIPQDSWKQAITDGRGGGYVGMGLATFINNIVGFWGGLVLLLALFLISLILILNTPLEKIIGPESFPAKVWQEIKRFFKEEDSFKILTKNQ